MKDHEGQREKRKGEKKLLKLDGQGRSEIIAYKVQRYFLPNQNSKAK